MVNTLANSTKVSDQEIQQVTTKATRDGQIDFVVLYEEFVEKRNLTLDEYQDVMYLIRTQQV